MNSARSRCQDAVRPRHAHLRRLSPNLRSPPSWSPEIRLRSRDLARGLERVARPHWIFHSRPHRRPNKLRRNISGVPAPPMRARNLDQAARLFPGPRLHLCLAPDHAAKPGCADTGHSRRDWLESCPLPPIRRQCPAPELTPDRLSSPSACAARANRQLAPSACLTRRADCSSLRSPRASLEPYCPAS